MCSFANGFIGHCVFQRVRACSSYSWYVLEIDAKSFLSLQQCRWWAFKIQAKLLLILFWKLPPKKFLYSGAKLEQQQWNAILLSASGFDYFVIKNVSREEIGKEQTTTLFVQHNFVFFSVWYRGVTFHITIIAHFTLSGWNLRLSAPRLF